MTENIYPTVTSLQPTLETMQLVDRALHESRAQEMRNQRFQLEKELKRYQKLKSRWCKADVAIKIGGVLLISGTGIASTVVGVVASPLATILIVVGVLGAVESIAVSGTILGLTERKKQMYEQKCRVIQGYIDKMYYYIEKVNEDKIVTEQEMDGFRKIMDDYRKSLQEVNGVQLDTKAVRQIADELIKKGFVNSLSNVPALQKPNPQR